ncbi:MAG: hypothetical protein VX929_07645 [Pseudomonadota bacterium]|nr:hypothetical protein [Pseudomonadota bacterium]
MGSRISHVGARLRASLLNSLEQQLELELDFVASIASSPETLKTLEAFFEQRKK